MKLRKTFEVSVSKVHGCLEKELNEKCPSTPHPAVPATRSQRVAEDSPRMMAAVPWWKRLSGEAGEMEDAASHSIEKSCF